jgi:hypothetical protein
MPYNLKMTDRLAQGKSDVFYDHDDNGEFQVLSSELIAELDTKIENALASTDMVAYDSYQLSDRSSIVTASMDSLSVTENTLGELVPLETQLTVSTMHRRIDAIEKVMVVTIAQMAHISQMALYHDYEELHTVTEEYITAPFRERYVMYRYVDGSYMAHVEQYDLVAKNGNLDTRPMTLYDACEVLTQLDDAVMRAGM